MIGFWLRSCLSGACLLAVARADKVDERVRSADWLRQSFRRFNVCTAQSDDGHRGLMAQLPDLLTCDADYWILTFQVHGYACHDTAVAVKAPGLVTTDPVREMQAAILTARPGSRIIAYMHPRTTNIALEHPEWRAISWAGQPLDVAGPVCCLNTPFLDEFLKPYLAEIVDRYDVDGFWMDGMMLHDSECACPSCAALFREETGMELPVGPARDWGNPGFRAFVEWRTRTQARRVAELGAFLRERKPTVTLQANTQNWRFLEPRFAVPTKAMPDNSERMNWILDEPSCELFWHVDNPGDPIHPLFVCRQLAGLRQDRGAEIWMPPTVHSNDDVAVPRVEVLARVFTVLANGCVPQLPVGWGRLSRVREAFAEIRSREPWLRDARSLRYAAILASARTRDLVGREDVPENCRDEIYGCFRALVEEHVPVDVIGDLNLEEGDLSGYRVLILPDAGALSDLAVERVRRFVADGGGLVATGRTSWLGPDGESGTGFRLAEVLGVEAGEWRSGAMDSVRYSFAIPDDYAVDDSVLQATVNRMGQGMGSFSGVDRASLWANVMLVRPLADAEVPLSLHVPATGEGGALESPLLVRNRFGDGRTAYLAANWGRSYHLYSYPYLRRVLVRELVHAAGAPPPIEVTAPMSVSVTCTSQPTPDGGGERLIIHLLNETGGSGRPSLGLAAMPVREEVVPIHGIRVRVNLPGAFRCVAVPEGVALDPAPSSGFPQAHEWTLPILGLYQILCIDASEPTAPVTDSGPP